MSPTTNSAAQQCARQTDEPDARDIDSQWLDDMVTRLLKELNRQMCQLENLKQGTATGPERAANARTLDSLERTLERLARMEREREALRQKKVAKKNDEAREALIRRLDQLLAAGLAPKLPQ